MFAISQLSECNIIFGSSNTVSVILITIVSLFYLNINYYVCLLYFMGILITRNFEIF